MSRAAKQAFSPAGSWLAVLATLLVLPGAASATNPLVINEIDYDQPTTDDAEFIEIHNPTGAAVDLTGWTVELIGGAGPSTYATIALPSFSLAAGGYLVLCGDPTKVSNCDFVVTPATDWIQDGPDAVALIEPGPITIDTVAYEGTVTGSTETAPVSPGDNSTDLFLGISRFPDATDTDDNSADLSPRCITPGLPNMAFTPDCRINATKVDTIVGDGGTIGSGDPGETIRYDIQITTSGDADDVDLTDTIDPNTMLVGGSLNVSPLAADDSFTAVGNTLLEVGVTPSGFPAVSVSGSLFDNDTEFLGDTFSLSSFDASSVNGGSVSVNTDGSFTYLPPLGFRGTDTFTYTIIDGASLTGTGTASIAVEEMVWYVDNTAGAGGSGRSNDPFDSLAPLSTGGSSDALDATGDFIFVHTGAGATGDGIVLEADQQLIGEGVALVVSSTTLFSAGTPPTLTASSGNAIDLATGNTIRGLDIGDTSAGIAFAGTGVGSLTVSDASISGSGGALDVDTGSLSVTLDSISSTASAAGIDGIDFDGVSGSFAVSGATSLSGLMGDGVNIAGSTATFSFDSLAITTSAGNGLVAGGGGTVNVTSAPSIDATGGAALDLAGTTTGNVGGASQWTFASLTSTTSPTEGIKLDALAQSFTVTGSTTISGSTNEGIEIDGSSVPYSFGLTTITDAGGNGIDLNGLTGSFTLTSPGGGITFPMGMNDNHGVLVLNSSGAVTIEGTDASNRFAISDAGTGNGSSSLTTDLEGFQGVAHIDSGDLTVRFTSISGIGGQSSAGGVEHGVFVFDPDAGSTITITDNLVSEIKNDAVEVGHENLTGTLTVDVSRNDIDGTGATPLGAGTLETTDFGIDIDLDDGSTSGRLLATIDDNTIDDVNSVGIGVVLAGDTGGGGLVGGSAGTENEVSLSGNTIRDYDFDAINILPLGNSRNLIEIANVAIDGVASPVGATPIDPDRGIEVLMDVLVEFGVNTSVTDLTITGGDIRDTGDEGIQIRNFGDLGSSSDNQGTLTALVNGTIVVANNGDQGLRVEAGQDGAIDLRLEGGNFSGNDVGASIPEDILVGVRSSGTRTIDSFLADTTTSNEIRIETDGDVDPTHQFGCKAGCPIALGTAIDASTLPSPEDALASILNHNGVTSGGGAVTAADIDFNDGSPNGDVDVVDQSVIDTATSP
jgi:hypothetical protein